MRIHPIDRPLAALAAIFGGLGVVLGAFGAHALQGHLDASSLQVWHTAVEYQFWHALALLMVAACASSLRFSRATGGLFVVGIVLFCGSLYALAGGAPRAVGIVTPFGGMALIGGWALLAFSLLLDARR